MSSSPQPDTQDIHWVLAYAILDSLSEDLRLRRRQGFWKHHPDEMADKVAFPVNEVPQPRELLRELHSEWVARLCGIVFHDTRGRVRLGMSDIIRRARA